ncbi:MAG: glycosyltransferase [Sphingobacteriales bacterium]|nr:glycosyltransferase [Sphingobacteriales bacterium]
MLLFPFVCGMIAALLPKRRLPNKENNSRADFACIITAYQHLDGCEALVRSLLQQPYRNFHIYLVADACSAAECAQLKAALQQYSDFFTLLSPPAPLSSKLRSLRYGLQSFVRLHNFTVVFDPDNEATPDFLNQLNRYISAGYGAVQGRRCAKNLDSNIAGNDAIGEIYKNHIERYIPFQIGSSATIAGSGMAIRTEWFAAFLQHLEHHLSSEGKIIPAEDKMLQNFLVQQQHIIAYAPEALLADEKIRRAEQVQRQRTRWLFAYFENIPYALRHFVVGFFTFNINRFVFGTFSLILPLFLLLSAALLLLVLNIWLAPQWALAMAAAIVIFVLNIFYSLWYWNASRKIWSSVTALPVFIGRQALALFQIKKAKKDFLTTRHQNEDPTAL